MTEIVFLQQYSTVDHLAINSMPCSESSWWQNK